MTKRKSLLTPLEEEVQDFLRAPNKMEWLIQHYPEGMVMPYHLMDVYRQDSEDSQAKLWESHALKDLDNGQTFSGKALMDSMGVNLPPHQLVSEWSKFMATHYGILPGDQKQASSLLVSDGFQKYLWENSVGQWWTVVSDEDEQFKRHYIGNRCWAEITGEENGVPTIVLGPTGGRIIAVIQQVVEEKGDTYVEALENDPRWVRYVEGKQKYFSSVLLSQGTGSDREVHPPTTPAHFGANEFYSIRFELGTRGFSTTPLTAWYTWARIQGYSRHQVCPDDVIPNVENPPIIATRGGSVTTIIASAERLEGGHEGMTPVYIHQIVEVPNGWITLISTEIKEAAQLHIDWLTDQGFEILNQEGRRGPRQKNDELGRQVQWASLVGISDPRYEDRKGQVIKWYLETCERQHNNDSHQRKEDRKEARALDMREKSTPKGDPVTIARQRFFLRERLLKKISNS